MKYCKDCHVNVDSAYEKCPLCHADLGKPEGSLPYPKLSSPKSFKPRLPLIVKSLILLSIIIAGVCAVINAAFWNGVLWSMLVIGPALYIWLLLFGIYVGKWNFGANVLLQAGSISALLMTIELVAADKLWAQNYVIPFLIIVTIVLEMYNLVSNRKRWRENLIYCFIAALIGFIPLILYLCGLIYLWWPMAACSIVAIVTIASFIIFGINQFKNEMHKRFHI